MAGATAFCLLVSCTGSADVTLSDPVARDQRGAQETPSSEPEPNPAPTATAAEPAPTPSAVPEDASAPTQGGDAAAATSSEALGPTFDGATYESIRDVDFNNDFRYRLWNAGPVIAVDGEAQTGVYRLSVGQIEFGDLDGDGIEEALVETIQRAGGNGTFGEVTAFRLVDGSVVTAGEVGISHTGSTGLYRMAITDGQATVWSYATESHPCCPFQVEKSRIALGEHSLVVAEREPPEALFSLEVEELKFVPGTSSATLGIFASDQSGSFTFEAARGQHLQFGLVDGPAPTSVRIVDRSTGETTVPTQAGFVLPSDSLYEVSVELPPDRVATTTMRIVILDDAPPPVGVSWAPTVEQPMLTSDPYLGSSIAWPVFSSAQPGTDAANETLAAYATSLDDDWADSWIIDPPQRGGIYEVDYEVTFTNSELASVRFVYFDACCSAYPNYGVRSAIVDVANGRLIPVEEVLDMSRIDEINSLWFDRLGLQMDLDPTTLLMWTASGTRRFDSLTIVADGLAFGTDRQSGPVPGTSTVLSFAELGDLVQPAFLERLAVSGS